MRLSRLAAASTAALLSLAGTGAAVAAEPARPGSAFDPPSPVPFPSGLVVGKPELLAVRINGVEQDGSVVVFRLAGGGLAVPLQSLVEWRIDPGNAQRLRIEGAEHVRLDGIPGLRWNVLDKEQMLVIEAGANTFRSTGIEIAPRAKAQELPTVTGGFLNYDLNAQFDDPSGPGRSSHVAAALVDLGASTAWGVGRTNVVGRLATGGNGLTRLDTTWTIDRPSDLTSIQIGDTLGTVGQWSRAVRFGGIRWSTDFTTRPGFISFPLPGIKGEATVPSVVDLYVNNNRQLQGNVQAGAFDLPDVPVVAGQGQIKVVVRDLLGREQVIVQPYYVTPSLLKPGLHDFSFEAGATRENFGINSFDYGRKLVVATDRAGVTPTLTREFRVELLNKQQTVGAGAVMLVADTALINASVAASRSDQGQGALATAGIDRQSSTWSASMQARYASRNFAQIGQSFGLLTTPRSSLNASFATSFGPGGVGVNALIQSDWQGGRFRTIAANYGTRVGFLGYASAYVSKTMGGTRGTAFGIFFNQSFGGSTSATESLYRSKDRQSGDDPSTNRSNQATVQVQSSPPPGPGFGYRVLGEGGDAHRVLAEGVWQSPSAVVTGGIARLNRDQSYRIGASGGMALMPEGVFLARRIEGSFAVVEVGDFAGVRVLRDNQVVARTDENGRAFVGGLRGYENNRIGIDAADLPLDAQVDSLDVIVAPAARSGVSITFPVQHARSATLRVVDARGQPLQPGSRVLADGQKRDFPVGFNGKLYLIGLPDRGHFTATWPGGRCRFDLQWKPGVDDVPDLGVATCQ